MKSAVASALIVLSPFVAQASVRLVRGSVGSKGAIHGSRYILEDPRTTFAAGVDRQVVAHFEWDATPGVHECVATWKDPTGATVLVSPHTQRAPSTRFSVYWTFTLPDTPAIGLWAVEARVDGEPAGTLTFQIQKDAPRATTGRRPLTPEKMYARAVAATLSLEAVDGSGRTLNRASAFRAGEGRVLTAFQAVEGASRLRILRAGTAALETDRLLGWNRKQDWTLLAVPGVEGLELPIDRSRSWNVGDRVFFIEAGDDGRRAIAETSIVGAQDFPGRGPRILLATGFGPLSVGGPLIDETGSVIGVLGGTLAPGMAIEAAGIFNRQGSLVPLQTMAVPTLAAGGDPHPVGETLSALASRNVFPRPLVGAQNVLTGTIARAVEKQSGIPIAVDQKSEFSRSEAQAVAFLTWNPKEKREGLAAFRIHDEDNKVVMEGRPEKLSLRPNRYLVTTWPFPLATLKPGVYRIDFVIGADPVWRSSFRIVE